MSKNKVTKLTVGPLATNCWIYPINNDDAVIIDPGDEADKIIFTLKKLDIAPKFILLTHGHFDHICAVPELSVLKPKIAIHSLDSGNLGPESYQIHRKSLESVFGDSSFLDAYWNEMPPADILLEEGSVIGPFTVFHLPGHSPGSAAFYDKEQKILFTGDTLFKNGYGRTDLIEGNEGQLFASLKRLFALDPDVAVYPGHGGTTTIGQEAARYSSYPP